MGPLLLWWNHFTAIRTLNFYLLNFYLLNFYLCFWWRNILQLHSYTIICYSRAAFLFVFDVSIISSLRWFVLVCVATACCLKSFGRLLKIFPQHATLHVEGLLLELFIASVACLQRNILKCWAFSVGFDSNIGQPLHFPRSFFVALDCPSSPYFVSGFTAGMYFYFSALS